MSWSCFLCGTFFFFFFSSRRRHTRFDCDWSSDVCSSDLVFGTVGVGMDVGHVRFQVLERFNSYARREDVDMSQLFHVGVWAAPRAWGYPSGEAGVGPEGSAQLAAPWRRGLAGLRAAANGVL